MENKKIQAIGVMALTIVGMGVFWLRLPVPWLQGFFGALLVLGLPGFAASLFFNLDRMGFERVALVVGCSFILTIFGGFLLNFTPGGLTATAWASALGGLTLLLCVIRLLMRETGEASLSDKIEMEAPRIKITALSFLIAVLAFVIVGAAWTNARSGALKQTYPGFTQLWMVPEDGSQKTTVQLGVENDQPSLESYILQIKINGQVGNQYDLFDMKPGEQWSRVVNLPEKSAKSETVEAVLYRRDQPETAFRRVKFQR